MVEGDEAGLKSLVLLLGRAGYDVLGVGDVEEARESLDSEDFDAVVVDLELPGEQWREVVALARQGDEGPSTCVVGVSVRGARRPAAEPAGLDARLTKPFDLGTLYGLLGPGAVGDR